MQILIAILVGAAIGVAATLFIVGVAGVFVAALRYVLTPPPLPAPGDRCPTCTALQALWNSMSRVEQLIAYLDFFGADIFCRLTGCPGLIL